MSKPSEEMLRHVGELARLIKTDLATHPGTLYTSEAVAALDEREAEWLWRHLPLENSQVQAEVLAHLYQLGFPEVRALTPFILLS